jgi:hypothetical protein
MLRHSQEQKEWSGVRWRAGRGKSSAIPKVVSVFFADGAAAVHRPILRGHTHRMALARRRAAWVQLDDAGVKKGREFDSLLTATIHRDSLYI